MLESSPTAGIEILHQSLTASPGAFSCTGQGGLLPGRADRGESTIPYRPPSYPPNTVTVRELVSYLPSTSDISSWRWIAETKQAMLETAENARREIVQVDLPRNRVPR